MGHRRSDKNQQRDDDRSRSDDYKAVLLDSQRGYVQEAPAPASTISAEQVSKANNSLAGLNALDYQDSYQSSLYSIPNASANTTFLHGAIVAGPTNHSQGVLTAIKRPCTCERRTTP
jgi:hypothetical protein